MLSGQPSEFPERERTGAVGPQSVVYRVELLVLSYDEREGVVSGFLQRQLAQVVRRVDPHAVHVRLGVVCNVTSQGAEYDVIKGTRVDPHAVHVRLGVVCNVTSQGAEYDVIKGTRVDPHPVHVRLGVVCNVTSQGAENDVTADNDVTVVMQAGEVNTGG